MSKSISTQDKIRCAALRWLARRDYCQHEITQKLVTKGFDREDICPVLTDLTQTGLISDLRFTENYIHWRRGKGFGPVRISMELKAKGIAQEMIAEHLQITDNSWLANTQTLWQKRFKGKLPNDFNEKAKQIRFLQYRGFTREQIEHVLSIEEE